MGHEIRQGAIIGPRIFLQENEFTDLVVITLNNFFIKYKVVDFKI